MDDSVEGFYLIIPCKTKKNHQLSALNLTAELGR